MSKFVTSNPLQLSPELQSIAFEELGETEELRQSSLLKLREKILHLPNEKDRLQDTSDENLIRFLRSRKYDLDRALENTIQLRHFLNKYGNRLQNITREEILLFQDFLKVIREPGPTGRIIIIMLPAKGLPYYTNEAKRANPHMMLRFNYFVFEKMSFDPRAQICGLIVINSFKGVTMWDHWTLSNMATMTDHLATIQHFQIVGTRFKGGFIFEEPTFFTWLWFFLQPFVSGKIKERMFVCGENYSILREKITDCSVLPEILGGNASDSD